MKLTLAEAKTRCKAAGFILRWNSNLQEASISEPGGHPDNRYFAMDLGDAVATAEYIACRRHVEDK